MEFLKQDSLSLPAISLPVDPATPAAGGVIVRVRGRDPCRYPLSDLQGPPVLFGCFVLHTQRFSREGEHSALGSSSSSSSSCLALMSGVLIFKGVTQAGSWRMKREGGCCLSSLSPSPPSPPSLNPSPHPRFSFCTSSFSSFSYSSFSSYVSFSSTSSSSTSSSSTNLSACLLPFLRRLL